MTKKLKNTLIAFCAVSIGTIGIVLMNTHDKYDEFTKRDAVQIITSAETDVFAKPKKHTYRYSHSNGNNSRGDFQRCLNWDSVSYDWSSWDWNISTLLDRTLVSSTRKTESMFDTPSEMTSRGSFYSDPGHGWGGWRVGPPGVSENIQSGGENITEELKCKNEWGNVTIKKIGFSRSSIKMDDDLTVEFRKEKTTCAAAYDISIVRPDSTKWQPGQDGVRVDVELSDPVYIVGENVSLVHLLDGGEREIVENVYFSFGNGRRSITGFSFVAKGFSIYEIVDERGDLKTPRRFYHFYGHSEVGNGGYDVALPYQYHDQSNDVVNVQIIKNGDFLKEPPSPSDIVDEEGHVISIFEGWYVVSSNERPVSAVETKLDNTNEYFRFTWPVGVTDMRMTFTDAVSVTESADWDYWVVPLYENARFLQFNENSETEQDSGERIIKRKLVAINNETGKATLKVSDVDAALKNSRNEYFCGWRYKDTDGQYKELLVYSDTGKHQDQYITVDDALFEANGGTVIPLYPYYVEAHFLHFNANAKSVDFVGSLFVRSTSNFKQVEVSGNRKGYDFSGWQAGFYDEDTKDLRLGAMVTDAEGNFLPNVTVTNAFTGATSFTTDANGNIRMNEDVTLYGTWVANSSAPYRVIIWQQRVTDSKDATDAEKKYYYVTHYTSPAVSANTTIAEYLLTSFTGTAASGTNPNRTNLTNLSGTSNITGEDFTGFRYARFTCEDETVASDGSTVINVYYDRKLMTFTFDNNTVRTGLYGQSFDWPPPPNNSLWRYSSGNSSTYMTFMDAFIPPSGDGDMTFTSATISSYWTITFYKQSLDGSYVEVKSIKMSNGSFNITDKFNGFHAARYKKGNNSEVTLGAKDSSGNYATVSSTQNATLRVYFDRNNYELIYKYIDNDGNGDEHTVYDTGKVVPYESSLAAHDIAYTNSALNWSECDIANRTFEGWYEDASLTVPFDFTATMPDGKKIIYARWAPKKHKVIIDPNGGELLPNEATWFYVDPSKDETIEEYTPTRKYRLDMHYGTYYYHYDPWDPVNDKHTDQYDPANSNATRKAYYTTNIVEATTNEGSNPENRYTYDPGAYAFMGWYQVYDDGTLATDPFSFGEPPTGPVTLRAIWRRLGIYTLKYESIDPDGRLLTETIWDPQHNTSENIEDGYVADAETTLAKTPTNYNKTEWMWEGWQVVDTFNNNIPLTTVRSPGDIYIVRPSHADLNNVIHLRAVYKHIDDATSRHVPLVTDLILDSNENAGIVQDGQFEEISGRTGIYTNGVADGYNGLNQGVWFAGQQNNFSVDLSDYIEKFSHNNGYFLLGWDVQRNSGSMIPQYYANETLGVNVSGDIENILYAVWEPQIYIEFINDTGADLNDVRLYIPGWIEGEIFRVNSVEDAYRRQRFDAFSGGTATFDLSVGERLCLVLPDGADKDFTTMGMCDYAEGTKLVISRIQPQIEGQEPISDATEVVYPGDEYMIAGTMKVSKTPVQVRFTKDTYQTTVDVPVRYFIHDPDGSVTEITTDIAKWTSFDSVSKTLTGIGSDTNDIAYLLRKSSTEGVHEYLAASVRNEYGYTTIGIGAAVGIFDEWRTISKNEPSGGSYLRFYHEKLEWSRYAQIWNDYQDAAVYVVFYKRVPVHVTIAKNVIGSEEDKDRAFGFTATFEEHSKTVEYVVTTTYTQKRRNIRTSWNSATETTRVATNDYRTLEDQTDTHLFSEYRPSETFSLKDGDRHPITVYFNVEPDSEEIETTEYPSANYSTTRSRYQTVKYTMIYQYETATIQESVLDQFTLASIAGETGHGHGGTGNVNERTYTISSKKDIGSNGLATYTPPDTTIFTNTRKTGQLTVSKIVNGIDEGYEFPFTVTLGETVVGKDTYVPPSGVHIGPYGKVLTFTLGGGDSVTLTGLPVGSSYVVKEGQHAKYVSSVPENALGFVTETGDMVTYVNTRKTDLTISVKDMTSSFSGEEQYGHGIYEETGTGSEIDTEEYTIIGLPRDFVLSVEHYIAPRGTATGSYTGHVENVRFGISSNGVDVTDMFLISMTPGLLTIVGTPITIEVSGNISTETYDGTEHVSQGYEYSIRNTTTGEAVVNNTVLVSVDPNYQQAFRTDVGKSEMHLEGHINVAVPEGFILDGIEVVRNGYMEVVPREVTVTADNVSKLYGFVDPEFTATVNGTIGDDTVSYSITREIGEDVGEYVLTPSGQIDQGNYSVVYFNGTMKIGKPSLIQRFNGDGIPVEITFTPELLSEIGIGIKDATPEAISNLLNSVDSNGLMRWENLRLGLETDEPPLSIGNDNPSSGAFSVGIPEPAYERTDFGYGVLYELWKYCEGTECEWEIVSGPFADKDELSIQLVDSNGNSTKPSGLYRVVTLIIPDSRQSITNQIISENIIGVMEVESPHTNTVVSVPWKRLASHPTNATDVTVSTYVSGANLSISDGIYALADNDTYYSWVMDGLSKWKSKDTEGVSPDGSRGVIETSPDANTTELPRGCAVWVRREFPTTDGNTNSFFVIGQYDTNGVDIAVAGGDSAYTLMSVPDYHDYCINDMDWSEYAHISDSRDFIYIVDGTQSFLLKWSGTAWCTEQLKYRVVGGRKRPAGTELVPYRTALKAGTGFWFCRHGLGFSVHWVGYPVK